MLYCTNPANNLLNLLPSHKLLILDNSKAPHKHFTTLLLSVTEGSLNSRYANSRLAKHCFATVALIYLFIQYLTNWSQLVMWLPHLHPYIIPAAFNSVSSYLPSANLSHCTLSPHIYIYSMACTKQTAHKPLSKYHLCCQFELVLIVVHLQAKHPINSLLPSHQHVRLLWVLFCS